MRKDGRIIKALEERALRAEKRVDELKDENLALKQECCAVKTELEEERARSQKLVAQINRNHENSSIPSSGKPNRKPITNNREKSGKAPGGQFGHEGHGRKKQMPAKVIEVLRYLLDSIQNEKGLTWSTQMRELLREMIHYRNSLDPGEDLDSGKSPTLQTASTNMSPQANTTWMGST